jgi:hypothetical protein
MSEPDSEERSQRLLGLETRITNCSQVFGNARNLHTGFIESFRPYSLELGTGFKGDVIKRVARQEALFSKLLYARGNINGIQAGAVRESGLFYSRELGTGCKGNDGKRATI